MTTPQQPFQSLRGLPQRLSQHHLSPRQRQYAMLSAPWPAESGCSG
jgi:hypothetical protein